MNSQAHKGKNKKYTLFDNDILKSTKPKKKKEKKKGASSKLEFSFSCIWTLTTYLLH